MAAKTDRFLRAKKPKWECKPDSRLMALRELLAWLGAGNASPRELQVFDRVFDRAGCAALPTDSATVKRIIARAPADLRARVVALKLG